MTGTTRVTVDPTLVNDGCVCDFVHGTDDLINDLDEGSPLRLRCTRLIIVSLQALRSEDYRTAIDTAVQIRSLLVLHALNLD